MKKKADARVLLAGDFGVGGFLWYREFKRKAGGGSFPDIKKTAKALPSRRFNIKIWLILDLCDNKSHGLKYISPRQKGQNKHRASAERRDEARGATCFQGF
jgi:hypothetical protein